MSWKPRMDPLPLPNSYFSPTLRVASADVAWLFDPKDQPEERSILLSTRDGGRTWDEVPVDADVLAMEPHGKNIWQLQRKCAPSGETADRHVIPQGVRHGIPHLGLVG